MKNIFHYFLEFLFPGKCIFCKVYSDKILCEQCFKNITFYFYTKDSNIFFVSDYCKENRALIHKYKYYNDARALDIICKSSLKILKTILADHTIDFIIGIPSYKKKNHLDELLFYLSVQTAIPIFSMVKRIRYTPPQSSLSVFQRKKNVENCFEINEREKLAGKNIIVIDDIYTTGSTMNSFFEECKKIDGLHYKALIYARAENKNVQQKKREKIR